MYLAVLLLGFGPSRTSAIIQKDTGMGGYVYTMCVIIFFYNYTPLYNCVLFISHVSSQCPEGGLAQEVILKTGTGKRMRNRNSEM